MKPKNDKGRGAIAAACAAATWAMAGIFVRWLPEWSPFLILAGRFFIAALAIAPILFLRNFTSSLRRPLTWWLSLPAIGSYISGTIAYQLAPLGEVTLLFVTSPLFIIAYKYVAGWQVKRSEAWGMLLAAGGVMAIALPRLSGDRAVSSLTIAGYLLGLGAAGLVAIYTLWFNALTQRNIAPRTIEVVFATCWLGGILSLLPALLWFQSPVNLRIDGSSIATLLGLGILSTAVPFWCYTMAAQRLPVILTTAILLLEPIFAALFASIALQEIPSLWFGIGSILVLCGLLSIATES